MKSVDQSNSYSLFSEKQNIYKKLVYIIFMFFAVMFSSGASAAVLEFTLTQTQTGGIVGPLNTVGDDYCPTASSPGCDFSNADNIVRTNDDIEFQFNVAVGPAGDDPVIITTELDPGLFWPSLPSSCNPITSSITGDGTAGNPSILNCDLGSRAAWSSTFNVTARAMGDNKNGTTAGIASGSIDAPNSTKVDLTNIPADVTISASPRMNLKKQYYTQGATTISGVTYLRVYYTWWIETWKHDINGNTSDDPDPKLGNEMIKGPVTFIEDPSTVSPNAYLELCYRAGASSYPYDTYNATYPERSVLNAGSISCSDSGPTATGPVTVTVTGADFSLTHTPTETRSGAAISSDRGIATFGTFRILVPVSDITAAGGSLSSVNRLSGFDPDSISDISNLDEDESDNVVARTLVAGTGSWSKLFRHSMVGENDPGRLWYSPPTTATANWAGDGVIQPNQYFATSSGFNNNTFGPVDEVEICDVIDTSLYDFAERDNAPGTPHYVYSSMASGGEGTGYVVEYGIGYVGTWPPATYPNSAALNTECTDPSVQWFSSYTAAKAAGTVTKARFRRLTPQPIGGGSVVFKHQVKDGLAVPNGTLLTNMASFRTSLNGMQWRDCNYEAGAFPTPTQVYDGCGDRLALTQSIARIVKTTVPNDLIDVVQAGGTVRYKLAPNFTSENAISDNITVQDTLPVGVSYANNSAVWNGVPTEPTVTGTPATGQVLTWNLGTWAANTPIPIIEFNVKIPITANNGTILDNTATIIAATDGSSVEQRSDVRRITVTSPSSLVLAKTTDTPLVDQDTLVRFEVEYFNGTPNDIPNADIIDILPYNGDNRNPASNFTGSYIVSPITFDTSSGTAYYTSATSSSIINDPQDATNVIPGGSTKWCTSGEFGTTGCPTGFPQVTAVRLRDSQLLASKTSRSLTIEITPTGNFGGELYTNIAQGSGEGVTLSAYSPYATSRVIEEAEIGLAKSLSAQDGSNLTFSFVIENLGNTHFSNVNLIDDFDTTFGAGNYTITTLPAVTVQPAGGNLTANASYTGSGGNINLLDPTGINDLPAGSTGTVTVTINLHTLSDQGSGLGIYENSATTEGTTPTDNKVSDTSDNGTDPDSNNDGDATDANEDDPTPINFSINPSWTLDKETTSTPTKKDDVMTYTFTAENTGNVSISSITLNDAKCDAAPVLTGGDVNTNSIMEETETWTYTCNHTVTQEEVDAGTVDNSATITGTPNGGSLEDQTAVENVTIDANPLVSIVKATPTHSDTDNDGAVTLGDTLTYTVTATNDGNVTLNNVVVSDAQISPNSVTCATVLPNTTCVLTGVHVIVAADTVAGEVVNTAEVTSNEIPSPVTSETITTPVVRKIEAIPETFPIVNGKEGGVTTTVLASDTLNGAPVVASDVTITVGTSAPELTLDPSTGLITVAPNTPAGDYQVTYTICENANPTNCSTTTETVSVLASEILAIPETFPVVNGKDGGVTTTVLASDTLNGDPVIATDVTITVDASAPEITLDPNTGLITVAPNTPAGDYQVTYTICENINSTNCSTTTETVMVEAPEILAIPETFAVVNGKDGGVTTTVLASDTLNGVQVVATDVTITVGTSAPELTLDPSTGLITVAPNTSAGDYQVEYTICENLNPTNCSSTIETVTVEAPEILAIPESYPAVNGVDGGVTTTVLASDTLNGNPVVASEVTITVDASDPALTLDPATGLITVAPGTEAGQHTVTYTICENLNPTNCSTTTETVAVDVAPIAAIPESFSAINGFEGGVTTSVLTSDTLNEDPVVATDVTITVVNSDSELTLDPATGLITVAPDTPAGDYEVTYTICENLNPTNCATTTETVTVEAPEILAIPESYPAFNGIDGGVTTTVLSSDTLNGAPVIASDVTITVGASDPALTLDPATGLITIAPGTAAGQHTVTYTICENLNPTNCSTTTETVAVDVAPISAIPETFPAINGLEGGVTSSVLVSDTLNGNPVVATDVTITVDTSDSELTLDPTTGLITVAPGTPAGDYEVTYTICENLNPTNCATTTETVTIDAPEILAVPETFPTINGLDGGVTTTVLASDTLNGDPVVASEVTITVEASDPALTLDPTTGLITVAPGTAAGPHTVTYTICENLNPTNCSTTTETVSVDVAPILAVPETYPIINGADGGITTTVLASDTLNGVAVNAADVTITVDATDPNLTLNPTTGLITVAPGTSAGDHTVTYTICENLNPDNCSTTTESVTVEAADILAVPETYPVINGTDGGVTTTVLASDTLNGSPVVAEDVTITVDATDPNLTLDPATGLITVAPGTPAGDLTVTYTICENLNPDNCSTTTETVTVEAAAILAVPETFESINGFEGGVTTTVLGSDLLNGVSVVAEDVTITVDTSDPELVLDPETGLVTVAPGTAAGPYTFTYTICENLNPDNCTTTTETVNVDVPVIDTEPDIMETIDGTTGGAGSVNVLTNDTLNEEAVDPSLIAITVNSSTSPNVTINQNGTLIVAAGTPAGTYTVEYTICEILNPTNCSTTTATVPVIVNLPPVAEDDSKEDQRLGQPVTIQTVANDSDPENKLDPTSVKLRDPSGNSVTTLVVPGEGTWTVDPATGDITFTPEPGYLGDPTPVDYTVKDTSGLESNIATVTIDYEEPAAIEGTVWLDRDKDNEIDPEEDRKAGWTLKIKDKDGNVIATTVTDAQGNYSVTGLIPDEYTVEFYNTNGTYITSKTTDGPLESGETTNLPLPVDPSGVVYDSTTSEVLPGVTLQLVNSQGTPVDSSCLGEGQQNQVTTEDGIYAFDLYPGAHPSCQNGETYTIKITNAPAGYYTDSTITPPKTGVFDSDPNESNCTVDAIANSGSCEVQVQPDAPQEGEDTTYYLDFSINSGDSDVIFNHVPLDNEIARQTELDDDTVLLSKSANKKAVSVGDQLYYTVRAENTTEDEVDVDVRDNLPKGFKFVSSVAKLIRAGADNTLGTGDDIVSTIKVTGTDPVSFGPLTLQGNEVVQIGYILKVGTAAATQTNAVNTVQVFASGSDDDIASNIATATVAVVADSVLDQSTLIGKVFHDRDGDGYQDPANVTGLTVKSDYFGWNSLHLGGLNGRVSVLDNPNDLSKYQKVIRMPISKKNDFKVTTQQGTVIIVDNRGQITTDHIGLKRKGLTGQDIRITTRRIKGIPTQTPVKAMRKPVKATDVLEITITNHGIHEEGIPGVRLSSVDGLLIETDGYGRYHLPDVDGGRRGWGKNIIIKVDTATLPNGSRFTTENPRVLRITGNALNKINFGIKLPVQRQQAPKRNSSVKSAQKVGGDLNKIVSVELGANFFENDSHVIKSTQMSNIKLLAENIKQYGRAEIVIDTQRVAKPIVYKRAQSVRQALYKLLGPQLMKSVKIKFN